MGCYQDRCAGTVHFHKKPQQSAGEGGDKEEDKEGSTSSSGGKPLWAHVDFMGTKNGMAEPQGLRTFYSYIKNHIAAKERHR
jgi:hypothetical protein